MCLHANAKLGLAGRLALVRAIDEGISLKGAAAAFSVSPATAHRWWHRWLDGDRQAGALLRSLESAAPLASAARSELQERICDCRRETGWGPRLVAGATGFAHSTVWKVLKRAGISRRRLRSRSPPTATSGPAPATCCTWTPAATPVSCGPATASPATAHSARATGCAPRPGSATTSRTRSSTTTPGSPTSSSTPTKSRDRDRLPRASARLLRRHGISAKRLMTDNGFSYTKNRSLRELLDRHGIRHLTTEPYRPRTNGKVERFHQTMAREWAYGLVYRSHRHRTERCHTGSTTTTTGDHTAQSATRHPSAAFTTSASSPEPACRRTEKAVPHDEAAQESNLPTVGLQRPAGFEGRTGLAQRKGLPGVCAPRRRPPRGTGRAGRARCCSTGKSASCAAPCPPG